MNNTQQQTVNAGDKFRHPIFEYETVSLETGKWVTRKSGGWVAIARSRVPGSGMWNMDLPKNGGCVASEHELLNVWERVK